MDNYLVDILPKLELYHRVIEWFGLERTLKIMSFQPHCRGQAKLSHIHGLIYWKMEFRMSTWLPFAAKPFTKSLE